MSTDAPARTNNLRVASLRALQPPSCVFEDLPGDLPVYLQVVDTRNAVTNMVSGRDDRLLVVVGLPRDSSDEAGLKMLADALKSLAPSFRADLIVVLDECTPYHVNRAYTEKSLALTKRWADRSLAEFEHGHDGSQALYGVVQGGVYEDLRRESAEFVSSRPFFGHAVGGCLGAQEDQMYDVVRYSMEPLRRDRPVSLAAPSGLHEERRLLLSHGNRWNSWRCVRRAVLWRRGCFRWWRRILLRRRYGWWRRRGCRFWR